MKSHTPDGAGGRSHEVPMKTKRNPSLLHKFWQSEIIADRLYSFLATQCKDNVRKEIILQIGRMEQGHATVWNGIATKSHGVSFRVTLSLRAKILSAKLLSLILPFTIFIHYMEHQERNAILDYSTVLEAYKDDEQTRSIIINMIRQEIGHEWHMMEQIADKESYIAKTREALDAMTVGIIETVRNRFAMGSIYKRRDSLSMGNGQKMREWPTCPFKRQPGNKL